MFDYCLVLIVLRFAIHFTLSYRWCLWFAGLIVRLLVKFCCIVLFDVVGLFW